jgi:hypothetical protein
MYSRLIWNSETNCFVCSTAKACQIRHDVRPALVEIDGVDLAQEVELLPGDVARDADGEAGAGERMESSSAGPLTTSYA